MWKISYKRRENELTLSFKNCTYALGHKRIDLAYDLRYEPFSTAIQFVDEVTSKE